MTKFFRALSFHCSSRLFLFAALAWLLNCQAQAVDLITMINAGVVFNLSFYNTFPNTNGFTGRIQSTIVETNGSQLRWVTDASHKDYLVRTDQDLAALEKLPEKARESLINLGLSKVTCILNLKLKKALYAFHGAQSFVVMDIPPELRKVLGQAFSERKLHVLVANEMLDGHMCRKVQISAPDDESIGYSWERPDLKNFPIKVQSTRKIDVMTIEVTNLDLTSPDFKVFDAPAGYTQFATIDECVQQASRRAKENASR